MTMSVIFFDELSLANSALVGARGSDRCVFRLSIKLRFLPSNRSSRPHRKTARRGRAE
jgi:hypothetical protein